MRKTSFMRDSRQPNPICHIKSVNKLFLTSFLIKPSQNYEVIRKIRRHAVATSTIVADPFDHLPPKFPFLAPTLNNAYQFARSSIIGMASAFAEKCYQLYIGQKSYSHRTVSTRSCIIHRTRSSMRSMQAGKHSQQHYTYVTM